MADVGAGSDKLREQRRNFAVMLHGLLIVPDTDLGPGGRASQRVNAVLEWAALHREDLRHDWNLARAGQPLVMIEPLD